MVVMVSIIARPAYSCPASEAKPEASTGPRNVGGGEGSEELIARLLACLIRNLSREHVHSIPPPSNHGSPIAGPSYCVTASRGNSSTRGLNVGQPHYGAELLLRDIWSPEHLLPDQTEGAAKRRDTHFSWPAGWVALLSFMFRVHCSKSGSVQPLDSRC